MKESLSQSEIKQLENELVDFKENWENKLSERATKWRQNFLFIFIIVLSISISTPSLWWLNIAVIGYFAGSLFTMLRQNAKTAKEITNHQKQLKFVQLLRKFEASSLKKVI